jgi:hypothetical protein
LVLGGSIISVVSQTVVKSEEESKINPLSSENWSFFYFCQFHLGFCSAFLRFI